MVATGLCLSNQRSLKVRQRDEGMPKRGRDNSAERQAIAAVFTRHNPSKLENLDALIAKYGAGKLLQLVTNKYEPDEVPRTSQAPGGTGYADEAVEEDDDENEPDAVTPLLNHALALRDSIGSDEQLAAYEAALRRTLDESVQHPPSTAAAAKSAIAALRHLALCLCQSGRDSEAAVQLATLGYEYRLAPAVLCYALPQNSTVPPSHQVKPGAAPPGKCVWIIDNALSPKLLQFMQGVLAPSSPFWSEHDYDINGVPRPYFSYLHSLPSVLSTSGPTGSESSSRSMLETLLATVYTLAVSQYPQVAEANFVEWWTHCRPHSSGHQFHFDSEDEGRGGVRHPIISTVLYLTPSGLGGPTLVTDQTLKKEQLATRGWLVHPRTNRLAGFDGTLLHGVVPGRGVPMRLSGDRNDDQNVSHQGGAARRVTFMAAFWRGPMSTKPRADRMPGSSQPIPSPETIRERGYTWPALFTVPDGGEDGAEAREGELKPSEASAVPVSKVWARVDEEGDGGEDRSAPMPHYEKCFQGF